MSLKQSTRISNTTDIRAPNSVYTFTVQVTLSDER
jgi:hypothetical protein